MCEPKCFNWLVVHLHFNNLGFVRGQGQRTKDIENKKYNKKMENFITSLTLSTLRILFPSFTVFLNTKAVFLIGFSYIPSPSVA